MLAPLVKRIYAYEPIAVDNAANELKDCQNISYVDSSLSAIKDSHFLVIATEYAEFWNVSPNNFLQLKDKVIFDGRNILNKEKLADLEIKYFGVGR